MSAVSALLIAASPSAQVVGTSDGADVAGVAGTAVGGEAQAGSLTLMFQQLLAAALTAQPPTCAAAAASAQLPAVLESLTAQLVSVTGGKTGTAGSGKASDVLKDADPTDVAAVAAALLAALQLSNGTPPPAPGGAGGSASATADAAIGAAPELTAALAQLLSATAGNGGDAARRATPVASLPTVGDAAPPAAGTVDPQARPVGDLALPAFIDALKTPDNSLRGASADASPTQHVIERLGASTAAVIPQNAGDGRQNTAPVVERTVTVPMQHPAWTEQVASQVRWCVDEGVQSARLQITPEHLGPVEIKLELADGKVNVNFGASHADTRAALEQSIPRLRELLSGAGLSLGEATVQQQSRQPSQNQTPQTSGSGLAELDDGFVPLHRVLGLVDEYA